MYESRHAQLLPRRRFLRRLGVHAAIGAAIVCASLLLGIAGYMYFEDLRWQSAYLNAAMLLGGMGPVDPPKTDAGRLFAGTYALYAGLVFLIGVGIVLAPLAHRLMHKLHIEEGAEGADQ
jgi:hypothetical protein